MKNISIISKQFQNSHDEHITEAVQICVSSAQTKSMISPTSIIGICHSARRPEGDAQQIKCEARNFTSKALAYEFRPSVRVSCRGVGGYTQVEVCFISHPRRM